jgi:2-dehydropantoate 2-reductase
MHVVVYGAGAIGGVLGARLHQAGHEVTLVARGEHYDAIAGGGLVLEAPEGRVTLDIPVVSSPRDIDWSGDPAVLLCVKGQHTQQVLDGLVGAAPGSTPVVCVQNGIENERLVLRWFANTYGMCVMCATTHLRPGHVVAHYGPVTGLLDVGRFPDGQDDVSREVAAALRSATFGSLSLPDVMRWKRQKLLMNLGNAVQALCGAGVGQEIIAAARREGEACLRVAGLEFATMAENDERRRALFPTYDAIGSVEQLRNFGGGSTWQSLARGSDSAEVGFLNGEIVLLGRLHGVPTPVNEMLQRRVIEAVRAGAPPGALGVEELLRSAGG